MQDYTDILKLKKQYENIRGQLKNETDKLEELYIDVAEKNCVYRKAKATSFLNLITGKNSATAAKILMEGETADARLLYQISDGILKATKENIKRLHASVEASRTLISIAKSEINIR